MMYRNRTFMQLTSRLQSVDTSGIHSMKRTSGHEISVDQFSEALSDVSKHDTVERIKNMKFKKRIKIKKNASVLVSLCSDEDKPSLLYTVRSNDLRNHGGQVSFPGGQCDWTDRDFVHTALRETNEEIGVSQDSVEVWAEMPPIIDRYATTLIHPVIGNLGCISDLKLVKSQTEVSKIFTVPLEFLCEEKNRGYTLFRRTFNAEQYTYKLPVFLHKPKIWGLTAVITDLVLSALFPDIPSKLYDKSNPWTIKKSFG